LKQNGDEYSGYHYIQIDDLQQGDYELKFLSGHTNLNFRITVHKGTAWGQDGFILKKNCLQENVQSTSMIRISGVKIAKEQTGSTVEVTVENVSGNVRLHAFAHQYLPTNQLELVYQIQLLQM
jgi:hypothetical protein